jgi:hypothetical protein
MKLPNMRSLSRDVASRRPVAAEPRQNPIDTVPAPSREAVLALRDGGEVELGGRETTRRDVSAILVLAKAYLDKGDALARGGNDTAAREYIRAALYAIWLAIGVWTAALSGNFPSADDEWEFAVGIADGMWREYNDDRNPYNKPVIGPAYLPLSSKARAAIESALWQWNDARSKNGYALALDALSGAWEVGARGDDNAMGVLENVLHHLDSQHDRRLRDEAGPIFTALHEAVAFDRPRDVNGSPYTYGYLQARGWDEGLDD